MFLPLFVVFVRDRRENDISSELLRGGQAVKAPASFSARRVRSHPIEHT